MSNREDGNTPKIRFRPATKKNDSFIETQDKIALLDSLKQDARYREQVLQEGGYRNSQKQLTQTLPRLNSRDSANNKNTNGMTPSYLGREFDRDLNSMELQQKIRDLENSIIDFKGSFERRLQAALEDQPQRIRELLKIADEKDQSQKKYSNDRVNQLYDQVTMQRDSNRQQIDVLTKQLLELQRKTDESDYRISKVEKQNEGIQVKFSALYQQQPQQLMITEGSQGTSDIELKLMRDAFNQEKLQRDKLQDDYIRQYQELTSRLQRQEAEFYTRLKQYRDELIEQNQITRQQIKGLDQLKLQQVNKDSEYIRSLIGSVEQKISDEIEKRLRSEFNNKQMLEERFQQIREELRNDEKQLILGEQKLARGVHESITSLNQILKNTKEQIEAQAAASQAVVAENIKAFSKSLDTVRETITLRVQLIEHSQNDLNQRFSETRQMLFDHQAIINEQIQKESNKLQQARIEMEQELQKTTQEQTQLILKSQKDQQEWKDSFEKKNLQVLTEVSSALKSMRSDIRSEKKRNIESAEVIRKEFEEFSKSQDSLFSNLEDHMLQVEKQVHFQIDEARTILKGDLENQKIQLQLNIDAACEKTFQKCREASERISFDLELKCNDRLSQEIEKQVQFTKDSIQECNQQLREYYNSKESTILKKLEDLLEDEKEQREKLQKIMGKFGSIIEDFRGEMQKELHKLQQELIQSIDLAQQKLESEIRDKSIELQRQLNAEIANTDLRLNKKIDDIYDSLKLQVQGVNELLQAMEKQLQSFMLHQVEALKFEVKSMLKDNENEMFKIKVWLMKQVELMNKAMQDMHIHFQSEFFMEKLFLTTSLDQMQLYLSSSLEQIQVNFTQSLNQLQMDLEEQIEREHIDRLENQRKQYQAQKIQREEIEEKIKNLSQEIEEKSQNLLQDIDVFKKKTNQRINDLKQDTDVQIKDILQLVEMLEKELTEKYQNALSQLAYEVGESFDEIKGQIEYEIIFLINQNSQIYHHFEAKMFLESLIRQSQEQLEKEQQAGATTKFNDLLQEIQRLERKQNQTVKELDEFVQGSESNFKIIQEAIKAHTIFLNELDAKQFSDDLIIRSQLTELEGMINQFSSYFMVNKEQTDYTLDKLKNRMNDINESVKLSAVGEVDKLRQEQMQTKSQLIAQIQLLETLIKTYEQNQSREYQQQQESLINYVSEEILLMIQNTQTLEQNIQKVLQNEISRIVTWQRDFSNSMEQNFQNYTLITDFKKNKKILDTLIQDYNKLMTDVSTAIEGLKQEVSTQAQGITENKTQVNKQLKDMEIKILGLDVNTKDQVKDKKQEKKGTIVGQPEQQKIIDEQQKRISDISGKLDGVESVLKAQVDQEQQLQVKVKELSQQTDAHGNSLAELRSSFNDEFDKVYQQLDRLQREGIKQKESQQQIQIRVKKLEDDIDEHTEGLNQLNETLEKLEKKIQ